MSGFRSRHARSSRAGAWTWMVLVVLIVGVPLEALGHGVHRSRAWWRLRADVGLVGVTLTLEAADLALAGALKGVTLPPPDDPTRKDVIQARVFEQLLETIVVTNDGEPCAGRGLRVVKRTKWEVGLRWDCGGPLRAVAFELNFLDRLPPDHRQLARMETAPGAMDARTFERKRRRFEHEYPATAERSEPVATPVTPASKPSIDAVAPPATAEGPDWLLWGTLGLLALGGLLLSRAWRARSNPA